MYILRNSISYVQIIMIYITDENLLMLEKLVAKIFHIGGFPQVILRLGKVKDIKRAKDLILLNQCAILKEIKEFPSLFH